MESLLSNAFYQYYSSPLQFGWRLIPTGSISSEQTCDDECWGIRGDIIKYNYISETNIEHRL